MFANISAIFYMYLYILLYIKTFSYIGVQ